MFVYGVNKKMLKERKIYTLGWSLKKNVYLQVEIERYGGKITFPVKKNSW